METDELFQQRLRELILELRADAGWSYKELARKLAEQGLNINDKTLANRVQAGKFDGGFTLALLHAFGVKQLNFSKPTVRIKPSK